MKRYAKIAGCIGMMLLWLNAAAQKEKKWAVDYVNTLIGTPFGGFAPGLEGGGTMPCVGKPFAMTNFVIQTRQNKMGTMPYVYEDSTVIGFMATHQPTVWMGDYGYVSVMPQTGDRKLLPEERALRFSHTSEVAKPHYYTALLQTKDHKNIKAEIAASSRAGLFRFTFPASKESRIVIQGINLTAHLTDWANDFTERITKLKGYVRIDTVRKEITGYNPDRMSAQLGPELPNFKGYFVIQYDKLIKSFGTWDNEQVNVVSTEQYGTRMGAYLEFGTKEQEKVTLRVGTSFISVDQARINMEKELPGWDFEKLVSNTRKTWEENLSRIQLDGVSDDQHSIFYTAMFHCMLFPREFSEYGRYYSAFDDKVHNGNIAYNDYSLWDTYRALHPLLIFIQPERVSPMVQSLLQMYKEGGWLPKWPNPSYTNIMIGTHADAVIAEAYAKGFRDYDINLAYEAICKDAMMPPDQDTLKRWGDRDKWTSYEARGGLSYYHTIGYVPSDKTAESVSRTVEFSFDDYCVAQMAKGLGKTDDFTLLMQRSRNYKNLYNSETGFLSPRKFNGEWEAQVNSGFTEGDRWTYAFGAMHDVEGMSEMMGGERKFLSLLDRNFAEGHYRHDNEPGHHYIYLYDYFGQAWKTQELARKYTSENYLNKPLGINGNDDCGQMSAWYLFTVMGFYPVNPVSGEFAFGAPQFPKITLRQKVNGRDHTLQIVAKNLSVSNRYVKAVYLDGKLLTKPFIRYFDLIKARSLVFEMDSKPLISK